jgi:nucleoside-diphosphate-sugar epimerase
MSEISKSAMANPFKALGFRRQANHLHRPSADFIHGVHFQASQWGINDQGSFTVNLVTVWESLYKNFLAMCFPSNPATANYQVAVRIGCNTMNGKKKVALIAGATGVVGRNLLKHLLGLNDWDVIALSRRAPDVEGEYTHIAVDLLDPADCKKKLGTPLGTTHVFFAAYAEKSTWAETVPPNVEMLRNLLDALEPASQQLQHINLMHGTKWYGNHLGSFKTPAQEDDPRHMPPNFYYDQQDLVAKRQRGKYWTWSAARPHGICGFAVGNPMNLGMVVSVYAIISKALGLPLRHPGSVANADTLYQVTDTEHLSKAVVWMSTDKRCANEPFNITNGDIFRWQNMWPAFADYFGMDLAPPQRINLQQMMADKGGLWNELAQQHGLQNIPYNKLVSWAYGDFVFTPEFDVISSMTKARKHGFHDVVDSKAMFLSLFDELRENRVIP